MTPPPHPWRGDPDRQNIGNKESPLPFGAPVRPLMYGTPAPQNSGLKPERESNRRGRGASVSRAQHHLRGPNRTIPWSPHRRKSLGWSPQCSCSLGRGRSPVRRLLACILLGRRTTLPKVRGVCSAPH